MQKGSVGSACKRMASAGKEEGGRGRTVEEKRVGVQEGARREGQRARGKVSVKLMHGGDSQRAGG